MVSSLLPCIKRISAFDKLILFTGAILSKSIPKRRCVYPSNREEINSGILGFKQILSQLVYLIKEKNKDHKKYVNNDFYITASPISIFQTDKFKGHMRMLWERSQLSNQKGNLYIK